MCKEMISVAAYENVSINLNDDDITYSNQLINNKLLNNNNKNNKTIRKIYDNHWQRNVPLKIMQNNLKIWNFFFKKPSFHEELNTKCIFSPKNQITRNCKILKNNTNVNWKMVVMKNLKWPIVDKLSTFVKSQKQNWSVCENTYMWKIWKKKNFKNEILAELCTFYNEEKWKFIDFSG